MHAKCTESARAGNTDLPSPRAKWRDCGVAVAMRAQALSLIRGGAYEVGASRGAMLPESWPKAASAAHWNAVRTSAAIRSSSGADVRAEFREVRQECPAFALEEAPE